MAGEQGVIACRSWRAAGLAGIKGITTYDVGAAYHHRSHTAVPAAAIVSLSSLTWPWGVASCHVSYLQLVNLGLRIWFG